MPPTIKRHLGQWFQALQLHRVAGKLNTWAAIPAEAAAVDKGKSVRCYETATGKYFLPGNAPNDNVINTIKNNGIFEPEVVETARQHIRPGTTVLDVGANFGQMSVLFSGMAGPQGRVHAFEADEFVYSQLQKTLAANGCDNVTTHLGAVYDSVGKELFYPEQDFQRFPAYGSYGIDPAATQGRKLQSLTIDSLGIETPISFLKVDIQGSDLFAMRGAVETIRRHQMPILFEFEQRFQKEFGTSFQDYVDFVEGIGYRFDQTIMDINYLVVPR